MFVDSPDGIFSSCSDTVPQQGEVIYAFRV